MIERRKPASKVGQPTPADEGRRQQTGRPARAGPAGQARPPKVPRTDYYDPDCTRCPRLAEFLAEAHGRYPDYWARPGPSFGPASAPILIVGLAPGMHGANRTGRPFTGDYAGILLYETLYGLGLATRPESTAVDD